MLRKMETPLWVFPGERRSDETNVNLSFRETGNDFNHVPAGGALNESDARAAESP